MIQIYPNEISAGDRRDMATLPQYIRDLVACPPKAGDGVHAWLFRLARHLHAHRTPEEITDLLRAAVDDCGREVTDREILDAVNNSSACASQPVQSRVRSNGASKTVSKWPAVNAKARAAAVANSSITCVADLWESSPWRCDDGMDAEMYLDILFHGNPLLCLGHSKSRFSTAPREDFRGRAAQHSLIVPSPMTSIWGLTQDGKRSMHTLASTGPRRYLVLEFDNASFDEQVAIIDHLSAFAPLAMVLSSGGKSLHSWWPCVGRAEDQCRRFFRYAVSLGADPATWTRSQFVRLPQGWRADKGVRQNVYYFNPGVLPVEGVEQ